MKVLVNFWKLYGAGVLQHQVSDFEPMTLDEWKQLRGIAKRYKLYGLLLDCIGQLPDDKKPPQEWLDRWALEMAQFARVHWNTNKAIADLFSRWRQAGIHPVLLKGQGFARLYPNPTMRMIGDIDVYVCPAEFDRAMELVKSLPLDKNEFPETDKHITFFYRGQRIELHRYSANIFHHNSVDKQYKQLSESVLAATPEGFFIDDKGQFADSGEWISVPPVTFNVFYTFVHLWGHMYIGVVSHIRSFADWLILLREYKGQIDLAELERCLRQFDMLRYWQILACFAVRYMGAAPDDIPFYDPALMRNHKKYFRHFNNEIVGVKYDRVSPRSLKRDLHNLNYYIQNYRLRFGIYPASRIIKDFLHRFGHGAKLLLGLGRRN